MANIKEEGEKPPLKLRNPTPSATPGKNLHVTCLSGCSLGLLLKRRSPLGLDTPTPTRALQGDRLPSGHTHGSQGGLRSPLSSEAGLWASSFC